MMTFDIDLEICCMCSFYFCNKNYCIFQHEEGGDIFHSLMELLGPFSDNPCSQVLLPFSSALIKLGEVSYPFTSGGCLLRLPTDRLAESQISDTISKPSTVFISLAGCGFHSCISELESVLLVSCSCLNKLVS